MNAHDHGANEEADSTADGSSPLIKWLWLPAVAVVGLLVMFISPTWIVNFDGTSYLALAANLRDFNGYVAPDGSAMTIRGPGYPAVLSLGWLFGGYASGLAMAISRLVLVAGGVLAAQLVFMATRSRVAAVVGVVLFFTQPILYQAGAWQLFPDGQAAVLVVGAITLVIAAERNGGSPTLYLLAGFAASLAFLTKESHVLVIAGVVLWVFTLVIPVSDRLSRVGAMGLGFSIAFIPWTLYGISVSGALPGALPHIGGAAGVVAAIAVPVVSLILILIARTPFGGIARLPVWAASVLALLFVLTAAVRSVRWVSRLPETPGAIVELVRNEGYQAWWLIGAVAVVVLAGIGFALLPRGGVKDLLIVTTTSGFGLLLFAAMTGTVLRNAAVIGILLAVVGASSIAALANRSTALMGAGALVVAIAILGMGAMSEQVSMLDPDRLTAEALPTLEAAKWLEEHAIGESLAGTPTAFQSVWRLGTRDSNVRLVPIYITQRNRWNSGDDTFDNAYGWLGKPPAPERTGEALSYSMIGSHISAIFAEDINEVLDNDRYLVLTGNTRFPASPADGGSLALVLASSGSVRPVFVSHHENAQWVAIVEAKEEGGSGASAPIVRYTGDREDDVPAGALDLRAYAVAVTDVLVAWESAIEK